MINKVPKRAPAANDKNPTTNAAMEPDKDNDPLRLPRTLNTVAISAATMKLRALTMFCFGARGPRHLYFVTLTKDASLATLDHVTGIVVVTN